MRGYFKLQAKKIKDQKLRIDRSTPQNNLKNASNHSYRMYLTLGVTAGCLFLPPYGSIDEWTRWVGKELPI